MKEKRPLKNLEHIVNDMSKNEVEKVMAKERKRNYDYLDYVNKIVTENILNELLKKSVADNEKTNKKQQKQQKYEVVLEDDKLLSGFNKGIFIFIVILVFRYLTGMSLGG